MVLQVSQAVSESESWTSILPLSAQYHVDQLDFCWADVLSSMLSAALCLYLGLGIQSDSNLFLSLRQYPLPLSVTPTGH